MTKKEKRQLAGRASSEAQAEREMIGNKLAIRRVAAQVARDEIRAEQKLEKKIEGRLNRSRAPNKLRTKISGEYGHRLAGLTRDGAAWLTKALHPTDNTVSAMPIPDSTAVPITVLELKQNLVITHPTKIGLTPGNWDAQLVFLPNVVEPLWVQKYDQTAVGYNHLIWNQFHNVGMDPTHDCDAHEAFSILNRMAERWRINYSSVTVDLVASAVTNEGFVTAAQVPLSPYHTSYNFAAPVTPPDEQQFDGATRKKNLGVTVKWMRSYPSVEWYDPQDRTDKSGIIRMPNAYQDLAQHGVYMPLKLGDGYEHWNGSHDAVLHGGLHAETAPEQEYGGRYIGPPNTNPDAGYRDECFPHLNLEPCCFTDTDGIVVSSGKSVTPMSHGNCGIIWFTGLNKDASLVVKITMGIEMVPKPDTLLAPLARMPPVYDEQALIAYQKIARVMPDAFRSEYNSLGKLWDWISKIGHFVAPALAAIPEFGPVIAAAASGALGVGDLIRSKTKKK